MSDTNWVASLADGSLSHLDQVLLTDTQTNDVIAAVSPLVQPVLLQKFDDNSLGLFGIGTPANSPEDPLRPDHLQATPNLPADYRLTKEIAVNLANTFCNMGGDTGSAGTKRPRSSSSSNSRVKGLDSQVSAVTKARKRVKAMSSRHRLQFEGADAKESMRAEQEAVDTAYAKGQIEKAAKEVAEKQKNLDGLIKDHQVYVKTCAALKEEFAKTREKDLRHAGVEMASAKLTVSQLREAAEAQFRAMMDGSDDDDDTEGNSQQPASANTDGIGLPLV